MRLKKAYLKNCGPHLRREIEFLPQGIIGVFGPNGCGKSSLANAIYASLTNDWSRSRHALKEQNVNQLVGAKEESFVQTWWEHDQIEFDVIRGLRPPTNELHCRGERLFKDAQIKEFLENLLKASRTILDAYVFVGQWEMFAFLSADAAERAKTYAHLCGTALAERLYNSLKKWIDRDKPLAADVLDNSDELKQQLGQARSALDELDGRIAAEAKKLLDKDALRGHQQVLEKRSQWRTQRKRLRSLKKRLEAAEAVRVKRETSLSELDLKLAGLKLAETEASEAARAAQATLEDWREQKARRERRQTLKQEIQQLESELAAATAPKAPKGSRKEAQELRDSLTYEVRVWGELLESFDGEVAECPTCGTPTKNLKEKLDKARRELPAKKQQLTDAKQTIAAWEKHDRVQAEYDRRQASLNSSLEARRKELERAPKAKQVEADPKQLKETIARWQVLDARLTKLKQRRETLAPKFHKLSGACQTLTKELKAAKRLVVASRVSDEELAESQAAISVHETAEAELRGLRSEKKAREASRDLLKRQLTELKAKLDRSKAARDWIKRLEELRELFHRDQLPSDVAQCYLGLMEDDINRNLREFNDPFRVVAAENLSFTAIKPDGVQHPAEALSGGQKGVFAMAFREAINSIFSTDLGMMVLDEPTLAMDEDNLDCMEAALVRLSERVRKRGGQIILITHHRRLERVMDQVIELEPEAG